MRKKETGARSLGTSCFLFIPESRLNIGTYLLFCYLFLDGYFFFRQSEMAEE